MKKETKVFEPDYTGGRGDLNMAPQGAPATWPMKDPALMRPPGCLEPSDGSGAGLNAQALSELCPTEDGDDERPRLDFGIPDMSSWKTNSFSSFQPMGLGNMGGDGGRGEPPGAFFPPPMPNMAGMGGVGGGGMGMPPFFGGSAAELEAQAAELDLRAAQLKQAALQAEMAAQQARSSVSNASPMMGPTDMMNADVFAGFGGYGVGNPAMIPDPQWMPPSAMHQHAKASTKAKPKKAPVTKSASSTATGGHTTLMLRNIPNNYNREMVLELLDAEGFLGSYDFVYLPMDFHRMAGLGYAFVNLVDHDTAERVKAHFEGFANWKLASQKVCEVSWGEPLQGLEAHIERYRNSPVMHEDVPDKYKPVLYNDGKRIAFPEPTKRIRPPRVKKSGGGGGGGKPDAGGGGGDGGGGDF